MVQILDGNKMANIILNSSIKSYLSNLRRRCNAKLAIILVGNNAASEVYVKNKIKVCEDYNLPVNLCRFSDADTEDDIIAKINELNEDQLTFGILVQLPLPTSFSKEKILSSISWVKDIDCLSPYNLGRLVQGVDFVRPCAVEAVMQVFKLNDISVIGKTIAIINRSALIGQPLLHILSRKSENGNATVTVCHEFTKNIDKICKSSDIIISAVGNRDNFVVDESFIKDGAILIDIGFSKINNKVYGDIDISKANNAFMATTVPNGIGPVTIACLLLNFVKIAKLQVKIMREKRRNINSKIKSQNRIKNNLCRGCGGQIDRQGGYCINCYNRIKKSRDKHKENKLNKNECLYCEQPKLDDWSFCLTCYLKHLAKKNLGDRDRWQELLNLFNKQDERCAYSGVHLILGKTASLDHIIPISKGGQNAIDNLQWVHRTVNLMKRDNINEEFLNWVNLIYKSQRS